MQNNTRMCGNMTFILSVDQDISGYIVLILNWIIRDIFFIVFSRVLSRIFLSSLDKFDV